MRAIAERTVEGYAHRGFETVREAFAENFSRRGELGGACCVYHHGAKVVDFWGGIMTRVLVVYGTTDGHTAKIAAAIANTLRVHAALVDVHQAGTVDRTLQTIVDGFLAGTGRKPHRFASPSFTAAIMS